MTRKFIFRKLNWGREGRHMSVVIGIYFNALVINLWFLFFLLFLFIF